MRIDVSRQPGSPDAPLRRVRLNNPFIRRGMPRGDSKHPLYETTIQLDRIGS